MQYWLKDVANDVQCFMDKVYLVYKIKNMKTVLCIVIIGCSLAACYSKVADDLSKWNYNTCLKATVTDTSNIDCGLPVLSFAEDSTAIRAVTGQQNLLYVAKYLPAGLNSKGKRLCVTVVPLQPEEEFPCTAFGITYPHIKVVSAKERK